MMSTGLRHVLTFVTLQKHTIHVGEDGTVLRCRVIMTTDSTTNDKGNITI